MAGWPRLALSGGLANLGSFHYAMLLCSTGTLKGPQQPNWCQLLVATWLKLLEIIERRGIYKLQNL
ncbi:hypothetical protein [Adhaeribacter radiodurans]|uniref:Uncharacterized protein n=1 Tax=Adhaeribacter radiodurans TaxID=2745197 RepID=A0A7L7LDX4_9BACT|nr:hypothetical protein [Adhaeribacter radiodurans]QMU30894.1 hypothetical protein HUW48_23980 [Adhaeribacter radiodurans]